MLSYLNYYKDIITSCTTYNMLHLQIFNEDMLQKVYSCTYIIQ